MTTQKSLGQIAFEASYYGAYRVWCDHPPVYRGAWERIAAAVAEECAKLCEAEHLIEPCKGEDEAYERAIDHCAAAIRDAIK